jgi:hypothetical protein
VKEDDTDPAEVLVAIENLLTALDEWDAPNERQARMRDDLYGRLRGTRSVITGDLDG